MMKRIIISISIALLGTILFAQSPQKISYQSVIRNTNDQLISNRQVGIRISIIQGTIAGSTVYSEVQTPTTNDNGLINIEIGGGTGFLSINWANGPYFIKTEIDPNGSNNYTITGTSQLLSVPYALHAKTAESITGTGENSHFVGELYGGGIVVAVWKINGVEHGLIASLTDLSSGMIWSNVTSYNGTAGSATNGQANTNAIIAQAGHTTSAAQLCASYNYGGFSWHLPAVWELNLCYNAALIVNAILGDANGFQFAYYWSSTESYDNYAGLQYFDYGSTAYAEKSYAYGRVRAVRRF
jgi:hypothetical protein